jgi:PAS domain S-box-containing protein
LNFSFSIHFFLLESMALVFSHMILLIINHHWQLDLKGSKMSESGLKLHKMGKERTSMAVPRGERLVFFPEHNRDPAAESLIEDRFPMVFRQSSAGISLSSTEGRFIELNPSFCSLLGYSEDELLQLTCEEIIHPDDREMLRWSWGNAKDGKVRANSVEERYLCKDGSILWGQVSRDWIYDREGNPLYVLTTVQDISDKKRIEAALRCAGARHASRVLELEAANKELESFNYTVSHDLRSPLTSIGGFCELLLGLGKSHLDDQCKSIIRHIGGTVRQMDQLIETLLNFSRISNREMNRETVNLSLLARTVTAQLKMSEPRRQVEFVIAERALTEGDAKLLREVLENLLDNAWKYTGKQEKARIEFGLAEKEGPTVYYVRDNGPGFDMTQAERLFIPFHRLHNREDFAGYGIGLSTAQRIIQRHGGRIWAEGEPGKGATFYFTLGAPASESGL